MVSPAFKFLELKKMLIELLRLVEKSVNDS